MPVDIPTEPSREPVASYRTAIPCLLRLAALHGSKSDLSAALHGDARDTEFVPISRVIELAGEFGLQATHTQLDWQGLENTEVGHPILVLLNNTNLVILNESERGAAAEVAIWDPLHPGGQVFSVPRSNFEKAWTGHVLIITPPAAAGEEAPPAGIAWFTSATRTPTVPNLAPGNGSAAGPGMERNRDQTPQGIPLASLQVDDPTEWLSAQRSRPASEAGASAPAATTASAAARPSGPFGRRLWLGALIAVTVASFAIFAVTLLTRISAISGARHPVQETAATEKPSAAGAASTATPIDAPASSAARPEALSTAATPGSAASTATEPAPTPTTPPPSDTVATVAPAPPEVATSEAPSRPPAPMPSAPPLNPTVATVAPPASEPATGEASPRLPALVAPPEKTGPLLTSPPSPPAQAASTPPLAVRPAVPPAASAAAPAPPTRQPPSAIAGAARPPAVPPLSTAALVARGDGFLRTGDVASARLFYERAVDAGDGQAALRLGETFDPAFLQAAHLAQIHGDMATAVSWYRRARDLGVREADVLLRGATK
jgi:hypothetical protein